MEYEQFTIFYVLNDIFSTKNICDITKDVLNNIFVLINYLKCMKHGLNRRKELKLSKVIYMNIGHWHSFKKGTSHCAEEMLLDWY